MWALERNMHITTQHFLGALNYMADTESWAMRDRSDQKLDQAIFHHIDQLWIQ